MRIEYINGKCFEVIKPCKRTIEPVKPTQWDYEDIFDAYDNPSVYKQEIWQEWRWFCSQECQYLFGVPFISGRNCMTFSVTFNVWDFETYEFVGIAYITKGHNRLYLA